jgi:HEPN domain-containing protein
MKKQVEEWLDRAAHDLQAAELLLDREAYGDVVLFHIHQAVEKYLKGFLVHHGWELRRINDLETLVTEAMDIEDGLKEYLDLGRRLTGYYYAERYPPGPVPAYSHEKVRQTLKAAKGLIKDLELRK